MADELPGCFRFRGAEDSASDPPELGAILELEHNAVVRLRHEFEGGDRFLIMKIAEHDDEASLFEHTGQFTQSASEQGLFINAISAQPVQPEKDLAVRERAVHGNTSLATSDNPDGTDPAQRGERQTARQLDSPGIFAERLRRNAHRC